MKKLDNKKSMLIILFFILLTIYFIFRIWYLKKQNEVVVLDRKLFMIEFSESNFSEEIATKWLDRYLRQYKQKYVNRKMKINSYEIEKVEFLEKEKNMVKVEFEIYRNSNDNKYFEENNWYLIKDEERDLLKGEWVLEFNTVNMDDKTMLYVSKLTDVHAYNAIIDISEYNSSGQAKKDEEYYKYLNEEKFAKKEYTYKIENSKVFVTYDSGRTYTPVNYDFKCLDNDSYKFEDTTFFISPELTYFCDYSDNNSKVIISTDGSKNFISKDITIEGVTRYIKFINKDIGYAFLGTDVAMGVVDTCIVKTIDGGNTWSKTGYSDGIRSGSSFFVINEDVSFILENTVNGENTILYRSEDGCKSYNEVNLPTYKVAGDLEEDKTKWEKRWKEIYDTPEMPFFENSELILNVGQGSDGDYEGGNLYAKYISKDLGKTWEYKEQFKPAPKRSDG